MHIQAMSDLHLEFADLALPGGDILVLAGDTWVAAGMLYPDGRQYVKYDRFVREEFPKYRHVILINGNHEHYGTTITETSAIVRDFLSTRASNVTLLDCPSQDDPEYIIIDGVMFLGGTLWARFGVPHEIEMLRIASSMNDCRLIRMEGGAPLTPKFVHDLHQKTRNRMRVILKHNKKTPCILVTHHAPTRSAGRFDPYFGLASSLEEAYYSNTLDYMMKSDFNILAVVYGHTHAYGIMTHNNVFTVSNPRGYVRSAEVQV
jgi:hypothetical protein